MFHINPSTGDPGKCRAKYNCPFGSEDYHFETEEMARKAFEDTQETFPNKNKVKKDKIYRAGKLDVQEEHFPDLQGLINDFEETTPEGRVGRANALFASPDLASHSRWILGVPANLAESHELTVNAHEVYVYPIEYYEDASLAQSQGKMEDFKELAKNYWDSGMTLYEWRAWAAKANPPSGSWEILVPKTGVISSRNVSNKRVIEQADPERRKSVNWRLEPRRASKGLVWGESSED